MQNEIKQPNIDSYIEEKFQTSDKYEIEHLKHDWNQKESSARGVLADFAKRVGDPSGKKVLDMGFGNGVILGTFSKTGAIMSGVEVDQILFDISQKYLQRLNIEALISIYDGKKLPYPDNFFDYIYSTSVLEHVDDPTLFILEANRVLKSEGKMYLAFPNRFALRDSHTGLYFLGYLPRNITQFVLKIFKKGSLENWNLHFLSYFYLLKTIRENNIPFKVIMETESNSKLRSVLKKFLAIFNIHFGALLSHIILILEKK